MGFLITQPGEGSQNYKTAVRAASSGNVILPSGSAPILLGGVTLANNDRVLLKDQSNAAENGIYEIAISGGSYVLTRAVDANTSREVVPNMLVPVSEGTYAEQLFQLTTDGPIVLDTTPLSFGYAVLYDHGLLPGLLDDDHTQYVKFQNTSVPTSIPVYADGSGRVIKDNSGWRITGSALIPFADGVGDIGGSAIARPGEVWVKNRVNLDSLTADKVMITSSGKDLASSSLDAAQLLFLTNVTSDIQAQLDDRVVGPASAIARSIPVFDGTTGKLLADGSGFSIQGSVLRSFTDGGSDIGQVTSFRPGNVFIKTKINLDSLTASRVVISNASKDLISSATTSTELGFLSGVTGSVQTQIDSKENKASVTRITQTANYNVSATDDYIGCDSATPAASFTLTLPDASTAYSGKRLIIKDEGGLCTSYNIIVNAAGGQTIDGSSSYTLNSNYESVTLICNGTDEWFII